MRPGAQVHGDAAVAGRLGEGRRPEGARVEDAGGAWGGGLGLQAGQQVGHSNVPL